MRFRWSIGLSLCYLSIALGGCINNKAEQNQRKDQAITALEQRTISNMPDIDKKNHYCPTKKTLKMEKKGQF
jgi:hypothetical protein